MSPTHTTAPLIAYASAEWNKSTLPAELFAGQRVPEHTWARYTLHTGSLKIRRTRTVRGKPQRAACARQRIPACPS